MVYIPDVKIKTKACHCCSGSGVEVDNSALGLQLRLTRQKSGLSLRGMARKMGVSAPFVSDLERGLRKWSNKRYGQYIEILKNQTDGRQNPRGAAKSKAQ